MAINIFPVQGAHEVAISPERQYLNRIAYSDTLQLLTPPHNQDAVLAAVEEFWAQQEVPGVTSIRTEQGSVFAAVNVRNEVFRTGLSVRQKVAEDVGATALFPTLELEVEVPDEAVDGLNRAAGGKLFQDIVAGWQHRLATETFVGSGPIIRYSLVFDHELQGFDRLGFSAYMQWGGQVSLGTITNQVEFDLLGDRNRVGVVVVPKYVTILPQDEPKIEGMYATLQACTGIGDLAEGLREFAAR